MDELVKLDAGGYSLRFQAKLLAWHELHQLVAMHTEDARARALARQAKGKRRR